MKAQAPEGQGALRPRKSVAPRWVLLGLLLSFAVAFCIAAYLYDRYVAYERVAALHLLRDPDWAVRIDLEKVALYEPFRQHLLPLVLAGSQDSRLKPRLERLRQHSRVELGVDIREIAFSHSSRPDRWVLAVGGMFPNEGVAQGIHRVLTEEQRPSQFDPTLGVLVLENGIALRQAPDGVVLFASERQSLGEAFGPEPSRGRTALPLQGAASLTARFERSGGPGIERLTATLALGSPHRVTLKLEITPQAAPLAELEHWLSQRAAALANVPPDTMRLKVFGPNRLQAELHLSGEQLDAAGRRFAKLLRQEVFSAP